MTTVTGSVGAGGFGPPSGGPSANVTVALKPLSQRDVTADQVMARLRPKLARVHRREHLPAIRAGTFAPAAARPMRNINGRCSATI